MRFGEWVEGQIRKGLPIFLSIGIEMNQPHKHKDVIIAWANGAQIQYQTEGSETWDDIKEPAWTEYAQYRVKPEPKKSFHTFRIGVAAYGAENVYTITADNEEEERQLQADPKFIGWISDWETFFL